MVCTPEHVVHHVQVFRDGMIRNMMRDVPIQLFWQILDAILSHPVDEVDVAEMPADRVWVL